MAQTVKSIKTLDRLNLGGRTIVVAEIELGTEYLAKGVLVKPADLNMLTFTFAVPVSELLLTAEGAEAFAPSLAIANSGTEAATIKIQVFGSGAAKKEAAFELADKAGEAKEAKIIIVFVGRSVQL